MKDDTLRELFSSYGNVLSASVIMDRQSGRSKGFGFVELEDDASAQQAIAEMAGKDVDGRNIVVSVARPMSEGPRRDSGRGRVDFRNDRRNRY
jgi:RNA recognition motif-containing protein